MHCHTTVDPSGTWQQSWRALEKAYAEGRVVSIGVSNFDIQLLNELREISLLLPHLVQNWAEPGSLDRQVRSWCDSRRIVYQPYASGRNLEHLQAMIATALEEIAAAHNRSEYSIALRFFLQTGAAVIPRTRQLNHLEENLRVYDFELTDGEMARLGWDVHAPKVFDEL